VAALGLAAALPLLRNLEGAGQPAAKETS